MNDWCWENTGCYALWDSVNFLLHEGCSGISFVKGHTVCIEGVQPLFIMAVTSRSFHPLGFTALIYMNALKTKEALMIRSWWLCWSADSVLLNRCILEISLQNPEPQTPDDPASRNNWAWNVWMDLNCFIKICLSAEAHCVCSCESVTKRGCALDMSSTAKIQGG